MYKSMREREEREKKSQGGRTGGKREGGREGGRGGVF
jgi:hypothetical protein